MAIIKAKEIKAMSKQDLMKKLDELRLESIKAVKPSQGSSVKTREVKRTIARLLTKLNNTQNTQHGNMS